MDPSNEQTQPGDGDALALARALIGQRAAVRRFSTGSQHFVYEVTAPGQEAVVLRLTRARDRHLAAASLGWSARLRPLGVPLPRVLDADVSAVAGFAWVMLERLPGCDLGDVFEALPQGRLEMLAATLVGLQGKLDALPDGDGYGFALSEAGPFPDADWVGVLARELDRSRARIRAAGAVREDLVDRACAAVAGAGAELRHPPRPFLHDMTTRNVIVANGRLSGIVDVDSLCYGDPLYLPGLIGAILTGYGWEDWYLEAWLRAYGADAAARARVALYRQIHAIGLLSEIGQCFNRGTPIPAGGPMQARLEVFLAAGLPR